MTIENQHERDDSLDGTIADLFLTGNMQSNMKFIFPRRTDRLTAYGKLVIIPIIKHPLRATMLGFDDDKGKRIGEEWLKGSLEWTLKGDRCSPQARERIQTSLLIDSAFEDLPEPPAVS